MNLEKLTNLECFDKLTTLSNLTINNNLRLNRLPDFNNLKNLFWLEIRRNSSLEQLAGFNHIEDIRNISIEGNPNLAEINGFNKLKEAHSLYLAANSNLLSIQGFDRLKYVESSLTIQNRNLRQLNAFKGLNEIGRLNLSENIQLRSIQNFSSVALIKDALIIKDHPQLNDCCFVNCWIEQGIVDESKIEITNKGEECLDLGNIKNKCDSQTCPKNMRSLSALNLTKNPVFDELQFCFASYDNQSINYQIHNINDQIVAKGRIDGQQGYNTKTIPVTFSQKGHYFLLLYNDDVKEVMKFVKMN